MSEIINLTDTLRLRRIDPRNVVVEKLTHDDEKNVDNWNQFNGSGRGPFCQNEADACVWVLKHGLVDEGGETDLQEAVKRYEKARDTMSDEVTELQGILDEFEHECFMLRVEASETRARDDVVRKAYERIRDGFAGRIAALGIDRETAISRVNSFCCDYAELLGRAVGINPLSGEFGKLEQEESRLIGELVDAIVTNGTLTAEQVREEVLENFEETHETRYDHCEQSKFDWQAIADEMNELGSGTCKITATATSNLMYPDYMTKWYELSCGHSLTLKGDEAPKYCPGCGEAVS